MPAVHVWTVILSGGVTVLSGRIQNLFDGSLVPCHTIMLLYRIKHFYFLYDTFQPALHKILVDTKEVWSRMNTAYARMADLGSHGRYKLPVCVYSSVFPSGKCMISGRFYGLIFLSGAPGCINCPVDPVSKMNWLASIFVLDVLNRVS